jgi:hypothetical protein
MKRQLNDITQDNVDADEPLLLKPRWLQEAEALDYNEAERRAIQLSEALVEQEEQEEIDHAIAVSMGQLTEEEMQLKKAIDESMVTAAQERANKLTHFQDERDVELRAVKRRRCVTEVFEGEEESHSDDSSLTLSPNSYIYYEEGEGEEHRDDETTDTTTTVATEEKDENTSTNDTTTPEK